MKKTDEQKLSVLGVGNGARKYRMEDAQWGDLRVWAESHGLKALVDK